MRFTSPAQWLLLAAIGLACTRGSETEAREGVTAALSDTLGKSAEPSVGFLDNRQHLQVSLSAAGFPGVSDSAFTAQAKQIARFTLVHYDDAAGLDSITVLDRELVSPGFWRSHHARTFAVNELRSTR